MAKQDTEQFIYENLIRMRLKTLREKSHMTKSELSEISGLSVPTITALESNNGTNPRLDSIIAYCNAFAYEIYFKKKDEVKEEKENDEITN